MSEPEEALAQDPPKSDRLAAITFGVYLAIALPLILVVLGSYRWFFFDEWTFLAGRNAFDAGELLEPYNQHWVTVPIIGYRVLYSLFGITSYVPYQLVVVALHLTLAVLLRVVMRRAGVSPWVATATAAIFVLLGPGFPNIVWAFQMGFVGGIVLGIVHLLLADHDGALDRRDWFGLAAGALALMCTGTGVAMAIVVGLSVLLRRGWRLAAFHTLPLAVMYLIWMIAEDPSGGRTDRPSPVEAVRFIGRSTGSTFEALGHWPVVAAAMGVVFVVGLVLALRPLTWEDFRARYAAPAAMLGGVPIVFALVLWTRWYGDTGAHYLHFASALLLPALAIAADAVIERWRVLTPVVFVVLLAGVPLNAVEFGNEFPFGEQYFENSRDLVLGAAHADYLDKIPEEVELDPDLHPEVTVGWLRRGATAGKIPKPDELDPKTANTIRLRLGLVPSQQPLSDSDCIEVGKLKAAEIREGDSVTIDGGVVISARDGFDTTSDPVTFDPVPDGPVLTAVAGDMKVWLSPAGKKPVEVCGLPAQ